MVAASITLFDVTVDGKVLDIKANLAVLANISSVLSQNLVKKIEPIVRTFYFFYVASKNG